MYSCFHFISTLISRDKKLADLRAREREKKNQKIQAHVTPRTPATTLSNLLATFDIRYSLNADLPRLDASIL